jgi:uncharacterized protein (DUF1501 family)
MLNRRNFLKTSSLLAVGSAVPGFLAKTALATEVKKDETVLVVLEMTGGNDGLNTVIPYADDLYHKARPTLGRKKKDVIPVNDEIGLHAALNGLRKLLDEKQLAIVQGVGYPNPDRSHFESMDIWQTADPKRLTQTGWLGRSVPMLVDKKGSIPALQIGAEKLPLALQGSGGIVSVNDKVPYKLELGQEPAREKPRRELLEGLGRGPAGAADDNLLSFVQRRQMQTYTTLDKLHAALQEEKPDQPQPQRFRGPGGLGSLNGKLGLIARLIAQGFGTRVFYVSIDGFDTHARQSESHAELLRTVGDAIGGFFEQLKTTGGHDQRVVLMTFSEFGRRVQENGSKGTDHGAGSCLFVAGPGVAGGPVGKHPSLSDLDAGDLRQHTDFRRVYATLLDQWLGCDSRAVLGSPFPHLPLLAKKA